jgi:hypothetical protein
VIGRKLVASPERVDKAGRNGRVGLREVLKNGFWTDNKRRFPGAKLQRNDFVYRWQNWKFSLLT